MRTLVARNLSYRIVALLCLSLGAGWHFWLGQKAEPEGRIIVHPLPRPETQKLLDIRQIVTGYDNGGYVHTCGAYFSEFDNPNLTTAARLREKACLLESEEARKFVLKNWQEKRMSYLEIDYPCLDCRSVYAVLIEQNKNGAWQITIRREPDRWRGDADGGREVAAVALKRRRATDREEETHVVGESILVFEDAEGNELLTL